MKAWPCRSSGVVPAHANLALTPTRSSSVLQLKPANSGTFHGKPESVLLQSNSKKSEQARLAIKRQHADHEKLGYNLTTEFGRLWLVCLSLH